MLWNDESHDRLTALWNQDSPRLSTSQIGDRMGISKNAVVGKAHRLDLPPRPNPVGGGFRGNYGKVQSGRFGHRPPPVRRKSTLPPLASVLPAPEAYGDDRAHHQAPRREQAARAPSGASGEADRKPAPMFTGVMVSKNPCCWPIGDPGTPSFRYCDDPAQIGKPYCPTHCQIAYRKIIDRREAA